MGENRLAECLENKGGQKAPFFTGYTDRNVCSYWLSNQSSSSCLSENIEEDACPDFLKPKSINRIIQPLTKEPLELLITALQPVPEQLIDVAKVRAQRPV